MRLPPRSVEEVVAKARGGHFQLACMAEYEGRHSCLCDEGINHPNQACSLNCFQSIFISCCSFCRADQYCSCLQTAFVLLVNACNPASSLCRLSRLATAVPHFNGIFRFGLNAGAVIFSTTGDFFTAGEPHVFGKRGLRLGAFMREAPMELHSFLVHAWLRIGGSSCSTMMRAAKCSWSNRSRLSQPQEQRCSQGSHRPNLR